MGSTAVLGSGLFGAFTFFAKEHAADECNSHGLPLTPNTITITGLFQELKELRHVNLCCYLDLVKCDGERMICVSEYYQDSLEDRFTRKQSLTHSAAVQLAKELTGALAYLHEKNIAVSFLSPQSILFNSEGHIKLFNYGFHHMADHGKLVDFSIEFPRYIAPEVLLGKSAESSVAIATKANIWSLGIILLEVFMECHIYPDLFLKNGLNTLFTCILRLVRNHLKGSVSPLIGLLDTHGLGDKPMDTHLREFLELCLHSLPSKRSSAHSLSNHVYLKLSRNQTSGQLKLASLRNPFTEVSFDVSTIELTSLAVPHLSLTEANAVLKEDHLKSCSMKEVYFLWGLAGGDLQNELNKASLVHKRPPILNLPSVVTKEMLELGLKQDNIHLYDETVLLLPMDQLRNRLSSKGVEDYYPILPDPDKKLNDRKSIVTESEQLHQLSKLPLLIKERDIDYQFHRLVLYRRLLEGYPYTKEMIITESIIDICPLVRGSVWAALLNVHGDILKAYADVDKDSDTPTDRQIAVDIPRCHQYDLLLASTEGHRKFTRLLKAWVVAHPTLMYWQGLDSLCAPFLSLNFNNEALAFASLCAFIDKYLHLFFRKDNSEIMQEYLAVFSQIMAYHDPEIFNHLESIGFFPDLYAIPWFLTMFTHLFPLNKIYHLWDTLLLGNSSFPMFVGVAILIQLRTELLSFGFNECIMMFSDLPDIDIHQCVTDAVYFYQTTPPSLCVRLYDAYPLQSVKIPSEAVKEPLPLQVLRMESSPQISAHDLIVLRNLELVAIPYTGVTLPPAKDPDNPLLWRQFTLATSNVTVLDIRSREEYESGHMSESLNLPHTEAFMADGTFAVSSTTSNLTEHSGDIIVVIAGKGDPGPTFVRQLVRLNFPHVCLLQGGAGILRSLGLLHCI